MDYLQFDQCNREEKFLFVFAHPDDDVFISGLMRRLISLGIETLGAWLTSGGYLGGQERRENELREAMSVLGLPADHCKMLIFPDLGLIDSMETASSRLAEILMDYQPQNIFVTAFEGGHPDHDAANFIVYEARFRSQLDCQLFEFPLYNGSGPFWTWRWRINAFPPGGPPTVFQPLTSQEVDCKRKMMKIYSSQWMYMVPAQMARSRDVLMNQGEPYRLCPENRDHTLAPHTGKLNYERWFNFFMKIRFRDFTEGVKRTRTFPTGD
ncbi:MAG: PIG-L deacetylase family protein [Desulfomonilaceae bacterium]